MLEVRLVETDSYDRDAYARVMRHVPDIADLRAAGERLVPHFEALLQDLFALLFKLAVKVRPAADCPASTLLNRQVLLAVMESAAFSALKDETALDASRSGHAACALARRALALLRQADLLLDDELLRAQELARWEERNEQLRAAWRALAGASPGTAAGLERALAEGQARARRLASEVEASLRGMPLRFAGDLAERAAGLVQKLPRLDAFADALARSLGGDAPRTAGERLELAERLEGNPKLRQLARLAGSFRADARAARRRRRERAAAEVYRVGEGADLARLLPSELLALRNPLRRRDFLRRLNEHHLAQFDLRGDDRAGRGPLVVCVDGSGSMRGPRELWAKAVALALTDIARKQGRRARALVFSGPETELAAFDLASQGQGGRRRALNLTAAVGLAECFPGGGTDFEKPLRAALDLVLASPFRNADIVFITDGEATLSQELAEIFRAEKKRRGFQVYGVLVDDPSRNAVAQEGAVTRAARELGKVADALTTVSELTSASVGDLFRTI